MKYETQMMAKKRKKQKLYIPGMINSEQISRQQKRLNSASTRQINNILSKQSMDVVSTKFDSGVS